MKQERLITWMNEHLELCFFFFNLVFVFIFYFPFDIDFLMDINLDKEGL